MSYIRWIPSILLGIGLPAWFVFIIDFPVLLFLYMFLGYMVAWILVTLWATEVY